MRGQCEGARVRGRALVRPDWPASGSLRLVEVCGLLVLVKGGGGVSLGLEELADLLLDLRRHREPPEVDVHLHDLTCNSGSACCASVCVAASW